MMTRAVWITTALAVLGLCGLALQWCWRELNSPLALGVGEPIWVDVPSGAPFGRTAAELAERGILRHPRLLVQYARLRGDATRVRAGEYLLPPGTTAVSLLDMLVAGDVYLHPITVVEGSMARDFFGALQAHPAVRATASDLTEVMAALGVSEMHPEGQFFPDTYRFARGTTDIEVMRVAWNAMQRELAEAWNARAEGLPLATSYEALILASIVEKETRLDGERPLIAGVLLRRLSRGMRLQTDPTVIYGLGEDFDGDLRRRDLASDTPYNTYTRAGLPPTPIALPGRAALRATVQPADGEALYFVATGEPDGSHHFSATLEEHNAAVARYLERLRYSQRP